MSYKSIFLTLVISYIFVSPAQAHVPESVRTFVKQIAKKYVCKELKEFFRGICYPRGFALSPLGFCLFNFDMKRFDQESTADQIAMMYDFISQLGITDDFIAWNLGFYKSTVVKMREAVLKEASLEDTEAIIRLELARRLATRLCRINFFKNNWGKILTGVGVSMTVATVGFAYYLKRKVFDKAQKR